MALWWWSVPDRPRGLPCLEPSKAYNGIRPRSWAWYSTLWIPSRPNTTIRTGITEKNITGKSSMAKINPKSLPAGATMALGVAWAMLSLLGAQLPLQAQLAPSAPPQLQQALQGQSGAALHLGASTAPGVAPEGLADLKLAPGSMVDI